MRSLDKAPGATQTPSANLTREQGASPGWLGTPKAIYSCAGLPLLAVALKTKSMVANSLFQPP